MGAGRIRKKLKAIGDRLYNDDPPCAACAAGEHLMCSKTFVSMWDVPCCCELIEPEEESTKRSGPTKAASDVNDVQSTGRKRAAVMYPIAEGMVCEWAKLAKAGGGVVPIIGCLGNLATDRHHGPDKNTLNNSEENVHRICAHCHNRWHAKNDEYYGTRPEGTEPFIPLNSYQWVAHDPTTTAPIEEIIIALAKGKKK